MLVRKIALFLLLATLAGQSLATEIRQEKAFGREVITLDNDKVRASVTPTIGARMLVFNLNEPDIATLQVHRHHIGLEPDDQWTGAEYGGYSDMATHDWPGDIWGVEFEAEETEWDGEKAVQFRAEQNGVEHVRTFSLIPDSTVLRYRSEQKNVSSSGKRLAVRIHGEFALGEAADDNDRIFLKEGDGVKMIPYRLGWENPRFSYEKPRAWLAVTDIKENVAHVRWFFPVTDDRTLVWHGHNEGGEIRDSKGGFYSIDRFLAAKNTAPGESVSGEEHQALIQGLSRVDFAVAEGHIAGALVPNQELYGADQKAILECVIGGGEAGGPYQASITALWPDGQTKDLGEVTVPAHAVGKVASASLSFTPKSDCSLKVTILSKDGAELATFQRNLQVNEDAFVAADKTLDELKAAASKLQTAIQAKGLEDQPTGKAQMQLADHYVQEAQNLMDSGQFDKLAKMAPVFKAALETAGAKAMKSDASESARNSALEATESLR